MKAITNKASKRILAILICMALILAFSPLAMMTANAETLPGYNKNAAVSCAKSTKTNYRDCVKFARACAQAGGVPVQKNRKATYSPIQYVDYLTTYGYAVKNQLRTCGDAYVPVGGKDKIGNLCCEDNKGKVAEGDLLAYYCNRCHKYFHLAVVTGKAAGKDGQKNYWMLYAQSANGKLISNQPFYLFEHQGHGRNNVVVYALHFTAGSNGFAACNARVSSIKAKKSGKKYAKLSWAAVPGARGYNIYIRPSSKKTIDYVKTVNGTSAKVLIPKKYRSGYKKIRYTVAPIMNQTVNYDGTTMNYGVIGQKSALAKIKKK